MPLVDPLSTLLDFGSIFWAKTKSEVGRGDTLPWNVEKALPFVIFSTPTPHIFLAPVPTLLLQFPKAQGRHCIRNQDLGGLEVTPLGKVAFWGRLDWTSLVLRGSPASSL